MRTPHELSVRQVDFLFCPWEHRKLSLNTRVVMTTMLHSLAPGGLPTPGMVDYYYQRACHSVGLILTENVAVCPCASDNPDHAEFYSGAALRLWKQVCQAVHRTTCKIAPVLWHAGELHTGGSRRRPSDGDALSPSGINPITLERTGDPMTVQRMRGIIRAYALAAQHAQQLGFDAVSINGGEMSLIDQFLRADTNRRTDEYGGDLERRTRFARELICAVRKAVGSRFPIILRISQTEAPHLSTKLANTPLELSDLLQPLSEMGVDIFDCASPNIMQPAFEGSPLTFAGWVRVLTGKPTIAVGSEGIPPAPAPSPNQTELRTAQDAAPSDEQTGSHTPASKGKAPEPTPHIPAQAANARETPREPAEQTINGTPNQAEKERPSQSTDSLQYTAPGVPASTNRLEHWLHSLVHMLRAGEIDLLAFGHALMHNPAWVSNIREARQDSSQNTPPATQPKTTPPPSATPLPSRDASRDVKPPINRGTPTATPSPAQRHMQETQMGNLP